jgi:hypothetical protein
VVREQAVGSALREAPPVPVATTSEWLVVWEALAQYVANTEGCERDPKTTASLEAAVAVLNRMDDLSIALSEGAN